MIIIIKAPKTFLEKAYRRLSIGYLRLSSYTRRHLKIEKYLSAPKRLKGNGGTEPSRLTKLELATQGQKDGLVLFQMLLIVILLYVEANLFKQIGVLKNYASLSLFLNGWMLLAISVGLLGSSAVWLLIKETEPGMILRAPERLGPLPTVGLRKRPRLVPRWSILLWTGGTGMLGVSVWSDRTIFAFIGLGLIFVGALPLYLGRQGDVQTSLVGPAYFDSLQSLVPSDSHVIYSISHGEGTRQLGAYLIGSEQSLTQNFPPGSNRPIRTSSVKTIAAPGMTLLLELERALGVDFSEVRLSYLISRIPKALTEDMKLAKHASFENNGDLFQIRILDSPFTEACESASRLGPPLDSLGCELCSSIALALAKSSGRPVTIQDTVVSLQGGQIQTTYRLLSTEGITQMIMDYR
jgi:hypothetical protein